MTGTEDPVTAKIAAQMLGLSSRRVDQLCKLGLLACEKRGRDWFVFVSSIKEYQARPKDKGGRPPKNKK